MPNPTPPTNVLPPQAWADKAECRDADPALFWPASHHPAYEPDINEAKAICADCKVRDRCLAWALANEPYGIWGGLTEHERTELGQGSAA